ncbi:hypothetical protein HK099_001222, partial [Clydaea vesicula]
MELPIISLRAFLSTSANLTQKLQTANLISEACQKYGAFYVKDHNIPLSNQNDAINVSKKFFSLDEKIKKEIPIKKGGFTRGYVPIGGESGSELFELKEAFSYGYNWDKNKSPTNILQGENIWPYYQDQNNLCFQQVLETFFDEMIKCSLSLTKAFSLSLGFEEDYLKNFCVEGDTISLMRVFHYFPVQKGLVSENRLNGTIGSSPHTVFEDINLFSDWGFLTLILQQEDQIGLQIYHENKWKDIKPIKNCLFVNCGDYVSLFTNGKYKSPLHRVISPLKDERISFVLFFYPNFNAKIPVLADGKVDVSLLKDQSKAGSNLENGNFVDISKVSFGE